MVSIQPSLVSLVAILVVGLGACSSTGTVESSTTAATAISSTTTSAAGADASSSFDVSDWIVYQGPGSSGGDAVFLVHPDGTDNHEIPLDVQGVLPDWSPDGTRIVVTSRGGDSEPLYEFDLATESSEQLFECVDPCLGDDEPAYSPDGTQVVFSRVFLPIVNDRPSDCGLWIGDVATGKVRQVTVNQDCDREYTPRWSPDGKLIAYTRERGTSDAVFVIDASGGEERQLTDWDLVAGYPDWSPNGDWIVFGTYPFFSFNFDAVVSNLYRMRPDGSGIEQLTFFDSPSARASQPRYTPDGEWIVFTADTGSAREIWVMPSEGGEPTPLITGGIHTHPALQPHG